MSDRDDFFAQMDDLDPGRHGRHYDREGNEIPVSKWVLLFTPMYQILRQEQVGEMFVSTVWLGLDHSHGNSPPLIFETMVFGANGSDVVCRRYPDETSALAGHEKLVAEVALLEAAK